MTLLICPVRPGDNNEELRYAMRSWEENLILPDLRLMTVGYKPSWVNPEHHIEGNQFKSVALAVFDNVRLGAVEAAAMGEEEVIYMNDDFFCMDPVGAILPVRRNCTLAQHIAMFPGNAGLWWPKSLRLTASWLADQGYPSPDSYEVHRPLLAQPHAMLDVFARWSAENDLATAGMVPQWRTIYGVIREVKAYPVQDAKLGARQPGFGTPWVSTSDQSWRRYAGAMRQRFQKPSRCEQ
jgi:hypothetical protein